MIVNERVTAYINSLDTGLTPLLMQLEMEAKETFVPIIRKETQNFLKLLLMVHQPAAILEVGTAIGFSSILMAEYNPVSCEITTIENYEKRIPIAKANIERAELGNTIRILEGDAGLILTELTQTYDFIFMDAAKAQYIHFLPEVKRLLKEGGLLVSDNVLQEGDLVESRFAITRRNRSIHKRMREYLYALTHDREFVTTILPLGDGVTVSVKKGNCGIE
ncbi:MAG: O-methyltransferase [Lachnospiraceae bacterium]